VQRQKLVRVLLPPRGDDLGEWGEVDADANRELIAGRHNNRLWCTLVVHIRKALG
jgi:hypothetical protein